VPVSGSAGPGTPVITESGDTLFSSITDLGYTYQWYLGGSPIGGATDTLYAASTDGSYTLVVTDSNGCTDTSLVFLLVANQNTADAPAVQLWPNPATSSVFVMLNGGSNCLLQITDLSGKILYTEMNADLRSQHEINLRDFSAGMYLVNVTQNGVRSVRRLVVE
jgi:hypothetical protein